VFVLVLCSGVMYFGDLFVVFVVFPFLGGGGILNLFFVVYCVSLFCVFCVSIYLFCVVVLLRPLLHKDQHNNTNY